MNDREQKPTALVTGASSGIGRALALELARRGCDVVLVARREQRLAQVAAECCAAASREIRATSIPLDLSQDDSIARLWQELESERLQVDVLVNNAGYGQARRFGNASWEQHRAFLRVMLSSVVELTHRAVTPMVERGWGRILHVASLAADLPGTPGDTLYGPTKAFLVKFAQGHAAELAGSDVRVCALCPGYTYSEFHDQSGTREKVSKLPAIVWSAAEPVAKEGVAALFEGRALHYPGRFNRFAKGVLSIVPDRLILAAWSKRPTAR